MKFNLNWRKNEMITIKESVFFKARFWEVMHENEVLYSTTSIELAKSCANILKQTISEFNKLDAELISEED
jgi:hypothetical protein